MDVRRHEDVGAFYERAAGFLTAREADHCLLLGIATELRSYPQAFPGPNCYLTVEAGGEVVAAALMTPPHALALSHLPGPSAAEAIARTLAESPFAPTGATGPNGAGRLFANAWCPPRGLSHRSTLDLRIYQCSEVSPPRGVPGRLRRAGEVDRELLVRWLDGFRIDAFGSGDLDAARRAADRWLSSPARGIYLWEDGEPVAMTGYGGPTPRGVRISAVYTPPERRRRGYASACVAAVSRLMLDGGRSFCFLFTDLANPTSNHIYQEVGYTPVVDVDEYTFYA